MKKSLKLLLVILVVMSSFGVVFASNRDNNEVPENITNIVNEHLDLAVSVVDRSYAFLIKTEGKHEYSFNEGQMMRRVNTNKVYENPDNNDLGSLLYDDISYLFCLECDDTPLIYSIVANNVVVQTGGVAQSYKAAEEVFKRVTKRENEDVHFNVYILEPFRLFLMVCRIGENDYCIPFDRMAFDNNMTDSVTEAYLKVNDYRELPTVKEYLDACRKWIANSLKELEEFHQKYGEDEMPVGGAMFDGMDIGPKTVDRSLPSIESIRFRAMTPYLIGGVAVLAVFAAVLLRNRRKAA